MTIDWWLKCALGPIQNFELGNALTKKVKSKICTDKKVKSKICSHKKAYVHQIHRQRSLSTIL